MKDGNAGFTIIEVILFVAISGLLLVGAFVGMRLAIANSQFNDTTDSTVSYFQKQYSEVSTGVNVRDDSLSCNSAGVIVVNAGATVVEPGASDCVILGRLFQISPGTTAAANTVTSRYLTSRVVDGLSGVSDVEAFASGNYQVRISSLPQLTSTYEIPWSGIISAARKSTTLSGAILSIAVLRSPVSERVMVYGFSSTNPSAAHFADEDNLASGDNNLYLCIQSDGSFFPKRATLPLGSGQGQDLFRVDRSDACTFVAGGTL